MILVPVIASYSGNTASSMREYLEKDGVLDTVAAVAQEPRSQVWVSRDMLEELQQMHVLRCEENVVRLATTVFLEADLRRVAEILTPMASEFSGLVAEHAKTLRAASPGVVNFLAGIIAMGQGLGEALERGGVAGGWKDYGGRYARSKVDFDEECEARDAMGPDLQNKSVLRGERFTAVFIGPDVPELLSVTGGESLSPRTREYLRSVNRHLVDAYALLLGGEGAGGALQAAAEMVGIYADGKPAAEVITADIVREHIDSMRQITRAASSFYGARLSEIHSFLGETTAGRQGVPPESMMMHLWRYLRRITAQELYRRGFFTDRIPETGSLTVFYENDAPVLCDLL